MAAQSFSYDQSFTKNIPRNIFPKQNIIGFQSSIQLNTRTAVFFDDNAPSTDVITFVESMRRLFFAIHVFPFIHSSASKSSTIASFIDRSIYNFLVASTQ